MNRITNTNLTVSRIRIWLYYEYGSDRITNIDLTVLQIRIWLYYEYSQIINQIINQQSPESLDSGIGIF